jgi:hypothetical protein
MTPFKNFSNQKTWQTRIRRGGLYVVVSMALASQIGCGSDNGGDWEEVTTYEPTKGVVTTLEESASGEFQIVDEQVVASSAESRVIIKKLDGKLDTLTLAQAKGMVQSQDTLNNHTVNNGQNSHHGYGIGRTIWWGSMGYLMGRSFSSPVQSSYYRNGNAGFYGGGGSVTSIGQQLRSSAVPRTSMRPSSGRTGFFGGRSRSGGGSFGG